MGLGQSIGTGQSSLEMGGDSKRSIEGSNGAEICWRIDMEMGFRISLKEVRRGIVVLMVVSERCTQQGGWMLRL